MVTNCLQKPVQRLKFALSSPRIARAMNLLQIAFNYWIPFWGFKDRPSQMILLWLSLFAVSKAEYPACSTYVLDLSCDWGSGVSQCCSDPRSHVAKFTYCGTTTKGYPVYRRGRCLRGQLCNQVGSVALCRVTSFMKRFINGLGCGLGTT